MADRSIQVEVAWATPQRQLIVPVTVPAGTSAAEAVRLSGIERELGEEGLAERPLGVFGKRVKPAHVLAEGDRVEIYRPLKADPKVVRRELAAMGKTMGRGRDREPSAGAAAARRESPPDGAGDD
jgi:putative ubiquitin-RnfH superfamily antitoxin RatB of RatAB toxin-antitoxin module